MGVANLPKPSMYLPNAFREDNLETLHSLIRAHPLATLITAGHGGLLANLVPFTLVEGGEKGILRAHIAKANDQVDALRSGAETLVVFQGTEAYITPSWYASKQEHGRVVPTWNYVVVQAHGTPRVVDDGEWLLTQIHHLTTTQEQKRSAPWSLSDAPELFISAQIKAIIGIEIPISTIEGKWKVSQNRSAADRQGVEKGLREEGISEEMARLVAQGGTLPPSSKAEHHAADASSVESWLVSGGRERQPGTPLNVPLYPASNFVLGDRRAYARDDGTPGWEALEELVGGLEGGSAVAFASGMAGIAAIFDQLPVGSVVALPDDCYQGVTGLAEAGQRRGRWTVRRIAVTDTAGWIEACSVADLIWLESPSNPLLTVADLDIICAAPRKPGAILGVDNTFATPLNQRPLALGADVAVQSVTKFIGGHSDLLCGVVTVRDTALLSALHQARELTGATPGTLETFLAVRGARTLAVRLHRAQSNAMTLAERIASHPEVTVTRYPGLASHSTHEAARRQLKGFGTIISFDVRGGAEAADAVCARLRLIQHATSLGAVESTIERRASIPGQEHLPPGLLRLSVGIEGVEDLWTDLTQALNGKS